MTAATYAQLPQKLPNAKNGVRGLGGVGAGPNSHARLEPIDNLAYFSTLLYDILSALVMSRSESVHVVVHVRIKVRGNDKRMRKRLSRPAGLPGA